MRRAPQLPRRPRAPADPRAGASRPSTRFDRGRRRRRLDVTTLTEYQAPDELPVAVAFPPLVIDSLAAHLSRLGRRQLHVAETEKYAHVTYFFNGGVEEPFPGEDRMLVPSNREVPTYDLAPEMSAGPITDALVEAIGRHELRLHRRQLRQPGHGRPHRRLGRGGARPRSRRRLPRPRSSRAALGDGRGAASSPPTTATSRRCATRSGEPADQAHDLARSRSSSSSEEHARRTAARRRAGRRRADALRAHRHPARPRDDRRA